MKLVNLFLNSIKKALLPILILLVLFSFSIIKNNSPLNAVNYSLEAIFIGGQKNNLAKDKATLVFDTKKKTASCANKCTYLDLRYCIKKKKFKFTSVIPAAAACPDHLVGIESDLKENFPKINNYVLLNKKLYFFNKKDTLLIFYEQ